MALTQVNLTNIVANTLPVANGGTGVTTSTGSGAVVLGTSPTLTTPTLTTPTITGAVVSSMASSVITSGTVQNTTSGTSIDFTGIPSWVKRITVMFSGVSTNGTSNTIIQIGSGSVETSGYAGCGFSSNGTAASTYSLNMSAGFLLAYDQSAATARSGIAVLALIGSNVWTFSSNIGRTDAAGIGIGAGSKTTSGTIDRVRITNTNGTDTFDAGSINILYE
jgi:hypothetical protein